MNAFLTTLQSLSDKPRIIVGLMSGTSLDGLDIAVCAVSNHGLNTALHVKHFACVEYNAKFHAKIRPLFANPLAPLQDVTQVNAWVAREHAQMLLKKLKSWSIEPKDINILASHGQTIFHAPNALSTGLEKPLAHSATLQIGDGDHLAFLTQILTLSDFRQKHVAANGEGAPLVPYADFLLFSSPHENRIMLNIGGIANFTYLPAGADFDSVICTDTGPGNTLMDTAIRHAQILSQDPRFDTSFATITKPYDAAGEFARKGKVDPQLLHILMLRAADANPVDRKTSQANKSTGQETFNLGFILSCLESLPTPAMRKFPTTQQALTNLLATLTMFTARSIGDALNNLPMPSNNTHPTSIYISGGGVHNPVLVSNIAQCLDNITIKTSDQLGVACDAKEAALFAVLANQTLFGDSRVFANSKGMPATSFGKISLP
jgi:anhydro-N-acetylmuramic acid kinase